MKAFSYTTQKGEPRIGLELKGRRYNFTYMWQIFKELSNLRQAPDLWFIQIMIEMGQFSKSVFQEVVDTIKEYRPLDDLLITEDIHFDVPISRPQKILCLGRNYAAHAAEWKNKVPEKPMFFAKLPSSLLPHEGLIRIPSGIGRVDHEIELAVIIGKAGSRISAASAMQHVAGYAIANDITARDLQREDMKNGRPWTLAKGMDTFCPMGPFLVPADALPNPHNLNIELKVNGVTKQKSNTSEMVFKISEIISYITQYIFLQAGDIICTGTPEGTLPIVPGDSIEAHITELGVLKNQVIEA